MGRETEREQLNSRGRAVSPALGTAAGARGCTAVFAEHPAGWDRGNPTGSVRNAKRCQSLGS